MKLGKIYTWANREEARHLIGKKVAFSDDLKIITEQKELTAGILNDIVDYDLAFTEKRHEYRWRFIREIEEEPEELMTHMQLAEWCAKGFGLWRGEDEEIWCTDYTIVSSGKDEPVNDDIKICRWGSDEWIKPTKAVYEQDCKEETE